METADPRGRIHHKMRLLKLHKLGKCSSCVKSHVGRLSHKRNTSRICKKGKLKFASCEKRMRNFRTWLQSGLLNLTVGSPGSIHWAGALGGVSSRRHPLVQHVKVCRDTHISDSDYWLIRRFAHLWPPRRRWSCGGERILAVRPSARSSLPTARPVAGLRWESAPSVATLAQIPPCEHNVRHVH